MLASVFLVAALAAGVVRAVNTITILVGANTTANASTIFQPQEVHAQKGDIVSFKFVNGSYDVIQSQFSQPCIPASIFTPGFNGFDSGVRPTVNGTAQTTLNITIADNTTAIWFFENSTCSEGGVGGINVNDSSTETLDGFSRNAMRLNGTNATLSSLSPSPSNTAPSTISGSSSLTSSGSTPSQTSAAEYNAVLGSLVALPMAALALLL